MSSSQAPAKSGRGLVIAGGIVTGISVTITAVALVYFVTGLITAAEAMSMVFPFLMLAWLFLAVPTWVAGIALLWGKPQQATSSTSG